jgi:hypothetical protein
MSPSDFAEFLKRVKSTPYETAALLIGFDGGRALIGHSASEKLWIDLGATPRESRGFIRQDLANKWFNKGPGQRFELLERHTREDLPDAVALDALAALLNEGYLHCIVMTDPARRLYARLYDLGADMHHFNCSREDSKILKALGPGKTHPVFIDGGELLLCLTPNMYDRSVETMAVLKKDLKDYLSSFTYVFCWGWDAYNERVDKLFSPQEGHYYILGASSENGSADEIRPYKLVEDSAGESERATTQLLKSIDRCLHPHGRPAPQAHPARPGHMRPPQVVSNGEVDPYSPPCLLWDESTCASILKETDSHPISVVGVEGDLVRSRLAEKIRDAFEKKSRRSRFCRYPSLGALTSYIRSLQEMAQPYGSIVADSPERFGDERTWNEGIAGSLQTWVPILKSRGACAVLFVPPAWAEIVLARNGSTPGVWTQSLWATECMEESRVQKWLADQLRLMV